MLPFLKAFCIQMKPQKGQHTFENRSMLKEIILLLKRKMAVILFKDFAFPV